MSLLNSIAVLTVLLFVLPVSANTKTSCNSRELKRQDCRLNLGAFQLRLLRETIARNDGTWHTVDPIPLKGESVGWQKTQLEKMGGRHILQLWLWDKGVGETVVQSLRWYVLDVSQGEMKILNEDVVRRRRPQAVIAEDGTSSSEVKYHFDAMEKHALKVLRDGSLELTWGSQKKNLGKVQAHGI